MGGRVAHRFEVDFIDAADVEPGDLGGFGDVLGEVAGDAAEVDLAAGGVDVLQVQALVAPADVPALAAVGGVGGDVWDVMAKASRTAASNMGRVMALGGGTMVPGQSGLCPSRRMRAW
jgi:hypothetical protein